MTDYGAAHKSVLKKLDRIQIGALRLCIDTIKTTPTNTLLVEMEKLPLYLRRLKLSVTNWVKLKGSGKELPTTKVLCESWEYWQITKR